MFIGKYNKAAFVTYFGTLSSIIGIFFAIKRKFKTSIVCLVLSGVFDMFDGKVARMNKNRTESDKNYGIEIDSLSDTICFVTLPIVLFNSMGMNNWYNVIVYGIYGLAGIIRLAYFNINTNGEEPVKNYTGLPVTAAAIIFPLTYLVSYVIKENVYPYIATIIMALVGILFISKIKIAKPKGKTLYIFLALALLFIVFIYGVL